MSTAKAVEAPAPASGKKKLIVIVAAAVLALAGVGGAAAILMKKSASAEYADDADETTPAHAGAAAKDQPAPVFLPLDTFTVNLADRQADRYAQIGVTLQIVDSKTGDQIKAFMPAIRNNILMAIADRTAADLLGREGKALLAERIKRETSRALGYAVEEEEPEAEGAEEAAATKSRKKRKAAAAALPVKAVHFSNFIIQ